MTQSFKCAAAVAVSLALGASGAGASTLTTSYATFLAGTRGAVTSTPNPGNFDLGQLFLPTTSIIPLGDAVLGLSQTAQVQQPQNGYAYNLADGFTGELFSPEDANGNPLLSITITVPSNVSALGFEVAPNSNSFAGPNSFTVTLSSGPSTAVSLTGPNYNNPNAAAASQFFGFTGGNIPFLTITTTDPNGFVFGNFVDVPEPGSAALLVTGLMAMLGRRIRGRTA